MPENIEMVLKGISEISLIYSIDAAQDGYVVTISVVILQKKKQPHSAMLRT